jgi:hypothetical protein
MSMNLNMNMDLNMFIIMITEHGQESESNRDRDMDTDKDTDRDRDVNLIYTLCMYTASSILFFTFHCSLWPLTYGVTSSGGESHSIYRLSASRPARHRISAEKLGPGHARLGGSIRPLSQLAIIPIERC